MFTWISLRGTSWVRCHFNVEVRVGVFLILHFQDSLEILLTVCHTILMVLVWKFSIESTNNSLIDIFFHSHHKCAGYCGDTVRRNFILVTHSN